jgi:NAD(P)-dependent dehydrogenase (short-subunit alcohol dehydrogenase family)
MNFKNKTVLITGAAGNVGRAVTQAFTERGARLVLVDLYADKLRDTFLDENEDRMFVAANLLQPELASAAVKTAISRFGRIDVLCNLAGGFRMGDPVHETTVATWDFLFDLNARTVLYMAQAVVPHMIKSGGGKVVNVGAFAAMKGSAQMGAYIASKSAVMRLTEAMSAELRGYNINANCVLPTIIDTPENRAAMPHVDPALWVAPQDLANAILFLASDQAKAVHGASLPVCGLV